MSKQELETQACRCVFCSECDGSGHVWFSFGYSGGRGAYLGRNRRDDLDELETCHHCGGRGITETCERCQLLEEMDDAEDPWN